MKISKSILFFTTLFFINLNAQDIPPSLRENASRDERKNDG